jgi:hypothetical protein
MNDIIGAIYHGTGEKDDETRRFNKGDLVVFTGHRYSPDFVYHDGFEDDYHLGIVLGPANSLTHPYIIYYVYWFRIGRIVHTIASHMKLAYEL